jgi:hypothetical protein
VVIIKVLKTIPTTYFDDIYILFHKLIIP